MVSARADLSSPAGGTITQASVQVHTSARPPLAARPSRHLALIAVGVFSLTTSVTTLIVRARRPRTETVAATTAAPALPEAAPPAAPLAVADEPDAASEAPPLPDVTEAAVAPDDAVVQPLRVVIDAALAEPAVTPRRPTRASPRPSRPRLQRDPNGALDIR